MFWTFLALGLWIVLGGFISYYGDLQGRRWGKRRVSWFGMRPKHTAILITSLTGGFIALFSIVTLLLIAPNIRDVVLRGESAIRENRRLLTELSEERLQKQHDQESFLADMKRHHDQDIKQTKEDQAILAQYQHSLKQEQAKLQPLKDSVQALQANRDALQAKINGLLAVRNSLLAKNSSLQTQSAQMSRENISAGAINKTLAEQNNRLEEDNLERDKKSRTLQAANTDLQQQNVQLKKIKDDYINGNFEFYQKNVALQKEIDEKQQRLDGLTREVASLTQERDEISKVLSQMNQTLSLVADKYSILRQGNVKLRAGVELSRQLIDAHLRPEAVKRALLSLMSRTSDEAESHGAASGAERRAALLLPQKKVTLTGYAIADEDSQIDSLAQKWSGNDVSFVVVASTVTNCLQGEPVYVELHPYPVVRVYKKGEVVASRQIDGHAPNDKIINELIAFLQKDVTKAALKNGTIPKIDPNTGEAEVSVLGLADLFNLLERVRRMHGPVLLTAKAKRDLSSADPLNLTFHVARVKIEPPQTASVP